MEPEVVGLSEDVGLSPFRAGGDLSCSTIAAVGVIELEAKKIEGRAAVVEVWIVLDAVIVINVLLEVDAAVVAVVTNVDAVIRAASLSSDWWRFSVGVVVSEKGTQKY